MHGKGQRHKKTKTKHRSSWRNTGLLPNLPFLTGLLRQALPQAISTRGFQYHYFMGSLTGAAGYFYAKVMKVQGYRIVFQLKMGPCPLRAKRVVLLLEGSKQANKLSWYVTQHTGDNPSTHMDAKPSSGDMGSSCVSKMHCLHAPFLSITSFLSYHLPWSPPSSSHQEIIHWKYQKQKQSQNSHGEFEKCH